MKTIHKYPLNSADTTLLKLRRGYRLVHSEYLVTEKAVFVWIEVPLDVDLPEETLALKVYRTGEPLPKALEHLDTAVDPFGPEAYHVYRVKEESSSLSRVA
ncbi:DUF7352 domain-containing protein [Marinospirillum perlucidum]|uniref:DUF7352 domain-containing protein n=1 Tax=Marinospirillum perlucidum TaxID=1982602 RepID=UPI000DF3F258|nr:hypothetical protein [Marinospirillum perlucidum]